MNVLKRNNTMCHSGERHATECYTTDGHNAEHHSGVCSYN